jgi:hypothetical protein
MTADDLVIQELADAEAELREQIATLIVLLADVTFENVMLRRVFERERVERLHADATLARTRRSMRRQDPRKAAA